MGKHTREYRVWDEPEEDALKAGVKKHGLGAWEIIRNDPEFVVLINRTGVQLKDKWRNLIKFRHISLDDKELFHVKASQISKLEKQTSGKGATKQAYTHTGVAAFQESPKFTDGRSGTPTESVAYCDRGSQKSTFRSSSRRKKPALAADFVLDVEDENHDDTPECIPARSSKRQHFCPREDTRYGIYDKRRYVLPQVSASDMSDSACLGKTVHGSLVVKCPCGSATDDDSMIQCEVCRTWAHTKCLKNFMVEFPFLNRFNLSSYRCTFCQTDGSQRPCKRRSTSSLSIGSQSSEQDSRDSASFYTTDCKSGTGDAVRKVANVVNGSKCDAFRAPWSKNGVELPKAPQKQRSRRAAKRRSCGDWCSWLLPGVSKDLQQLCRYQKPASSPFGAMAMQQQSASSKVNEGKPFFSAPVRTALGLTSAKQVAGAPKALELPTSPGNLKEEFDASPASVKTCHTAEFKIPVSVLCGDAAMRNNLLVLESDDEDGAVSSSHDNPATGRSEAAAHVTEAAAAGILGSQSDHDLLGAASLDLPERFSFEFPSRAGPTPPPHPSLSSFSLELPLPSLAPSPMPVLSSSYTHLSAPVHSHPPLFNMNPMPAAFAAAVGKLESDASMLAHLPWMQALFGPQAWPLGLGPSAAAVAAAAASAVVNAHPMLELYKHGVAGLSLPPPSLKLEPLSLDSTSRPTAMHNVADSSVAASVCGILNTASSGRSALDQTTHDASLLPLLAELRSQTPDPGSFLNAPTPLPEMSLPLHLAGSCPLFDLPPLGMLPMSKTPPLPDVLLNVPSLNCPLPTSTFEINKLRPDDTGPNGFDYLHEFVHPDADEEHRLSSHLKEFHTHF